MNRRAIVFAALVLIIGLSSVPSGAGTVSATSCAQSAVQTAVNSASNGDRIQVPAGSCTWSSAVSIPNTKGVTVDGGGTVTIVGGFVINQGSATTRITGFNFSASDSVHTYGSTTSAPFRVDHNDFSNSSSTTFINTEGNAPGLIDNNTFVAGSSAEMIHNLATGASSTAGWVDNVVPGSANMLFIEDNSFTFNATGSPAYFWGTSAVQSYYGSRTVFRHNQLSMVQVDQHGTAGAIGARWWEIYENTFNVVPNGNQSNYMQIRAGSGVIFNNHTSGSPNGGAGEIEVVEEDTGYPALYQIGRGINQNLSPAYIWGNDATMPVVSGSSNVLLSRDYYVSSSQPATMLRQELNSDTSSTTYSYTPYTYPHPLQNLGPTAPMGLNAVVK